MADAVPKSQITGVQVLKLNGLTTLLVLSFVAIGAAGAHPLSLENSKTPSKYDMKLDAIYSQLEEIAKDPMVIKYVEESNAGIYLEELKGMNNSKWQKLAVRDPLVQMIINSELSNLLRKKLAENVSEAFVNDRHGNKVGMLSKTSNWNHQDMEKHEVPLSGKRWQGVAEFDASTGLHQIQISVPIVNSQKVIIGSFVVGVKIASLR